jgi:hypothetical protein
MKRLARAGVAVFAVGLAAGAAQAAAAPLSCEVRDVDRFGAGRLPVPAVELAPIGNGGVAWAPAAAGAGALAAQRLGGGVPVDAVARLAVGGPVHGLRAVATPADETVLLFQRTSAIDRPTVMAATLGRRGLDEPVTLSSDHASRPDVAVAADGGVRAAWIEVVGTEGFRVMTATRSVAGEWSAPAMIAGSPQTVQLVDVRVLAGPDGRAFVAWRTAGWDGSGAGVRVLRLGPGGTPEGPPLAVRDGAAVVADLALGGSPQGALVAWRDQAEGQTGQAVMAVHVPAEGAPGEVRRLSSEGTTGLAPDIAAANGRLGLVGWVEEVGARRTARVMRLDTRTGAVTPWISSGIRRGTGIAVAAGPDGGGAALWRDRADGGRRLVLGSGSLTKAEPTHRGVIAQALGSRTDRFLSVSPAVDVARIGLITVAAARPTAAFRTALQVATCRPSPPRFTLSAAQLLVNQRIAQAALRRIDALAARLDRIPAPAAGAGTPGGVTLSLRQLRINHRVSVAAFRRGNDLSRRLDGLPPAPTAPRGVGGPGSLTARALQGVQVIASAAVKSANALAERIPELPATLPGPLSPQLDDLVGTLEEPGRLVMRVGTVRRRGTLGDGAPVQPGTRVPVVVLGTQRPSFGLGAPIGAIGVLHGGVMYGAYVSIEEPPGAGAR